MENYTKNLRIDLYVMTATISSCLLRAFSFSKNLSGLNHTRKTLRILDTYECQVTTVFRICTNIYLIPSIASPAYIPTAYPLCPPPGVDMELLL